MLTKDKSINNYILRQFSIAETMKIPCEKYPTDKILRPHQSSGVKENETRPNKTWHGVLPAFDGKMMYFWL